MPDENDRWREAAEYAEQNLMTALQVMVNLMSDEQQASTARASVIKTFVDVAVKLREMNNTNQDQAALIDKLLDEFEDEIDWGESEEDFEGSTDFVDD